MLPIDASVITTQAANAYTAAADAWNGHTDALVDPSGTIQYTSLAALAGGALAALVVIWLYGALVMPAMQCLGRTKCYMQWPVLIYVAPDEDRLPYLWPKGQSRFAARGRAPKVRATAAQWTAMRAALGPHVPDKNVFDLLQKHGDDTRSAQQDFYGVGGSY